MRKIKELLKVLSNALSPEIKDTQPALISDDEVLSRFIFDKKYFNTQGAKQAAFLPELHPTDNRYETSVFRKTMSTSEYDGIKNKISKLRGRELKAAALIPAYKVKSVKNLNVLPEESDHRWHAIIVDWPADKEERKSLAQSLALNSRLE